MNTSTVMRSMASSAVSRKIGGASSAGGTAGAVAGRRRGRRPAATSFCSNGAGVVDRAQAASAISDNPSPAAIFRRVSMGESPCCQDNTVLRRKCRNPCRGNMGAAGRLGKAAPKSEKAGGPGTAAFQLRLGRLAEAKPPEGLVFLRRRDPLAVGAGQSSSRRGADGAVRPSPCLPRRNWRPGRGATGACSGEKAKFSFRNGHRSDSAR